MHAFLAPTLISLTTRIGLYFVCTTRFNGSSALILELLHRLCKIFKDYCGILTEESIRKNFILIYELLDECMDFGYAQGTSTELLKAHVHNEAVVIENASTVKMPMMKSNFKSSTAVRKPIAISGDQSRNSENEVCRHYLPELHTRREIRSSCADFLRYSGTAERGLLLARAGVTTRHRSGQQFISDCVDSCRS